MTTNAHSCRNERVVRARISTHELEYSLTLSTLPTIALDLFSLPRRAVQNCQNCSPLRSLCFLPPAALKAAPLTTRGAGHLHSAGKQDSGARVHSDRPIHYALESLPGGFTTPASLSGFNCRPVRVAYALPPQAFRVYRLARTTVVIRTLRTGARGCRAAAWFCRTTSAAERLRCRPGTSG
jgi:hypothetical protein